MNVEFGTETCSCPTGGTNVLPCWCNYGSASTVCHKATITCTLAACPVGLLAGRPEPSCVQGRTSGCPLEQVRQQRRWKGDSEMGVGKGKNWAEEGMGG